MAWVRRATKLMKRLVRRAGSQLRQRGLGVASRALRLTTATVAAYVVAGVLLTDTVPVIAALTALLVVEVTLFDILTSGLQRVVSVLAGVFLAVAFSSLVGFNWWSLGVLVAASILVGQALRLGPHLVEVPISAMLVLAVRGNEAVAGDRIIETLIGAAVGIAVSLLFPPRIRSGTAARAVGDFADEIAGLLRSAAAELVDGISVEDATLWLDEARRLSRRVPEVDRAVEQAEQSRRLNPRSLSEGDTSEVLRGGWEALEHSSVAVRTMFRGVVDGVRDHPQAAGESAQAVRQAFATLLGELGDAVHAYGDLVRAEVAETTEPAENEAIIALNALQEARVRVVELRLVEHHEDQATWELNDALLETVERVMAELDIDQQTRLRRQRRAPAMAAPLTALRAAHHSLRTGTEHLVDRRRFADPTQTRRQARRISPGQMR